MLFNLLTLIGCAAHSKSQAVTFEISSATPEPTVVQETYEPIGMPCMDVIVYYYETAGCTDVRNAGMPNEDLGAYLHCEAMENLGTKASEISSLPFLLRIHDLEAPVPQNSAMFCMDPWFEVWAYVGE
jgi:hypothetical protein